MTREVLDTRRARRLAERETERIVLERSWPRLRLSARGGAKAGVCAAVALALLTEEADATALGAGLAALLWTVLDLLGQVLQRPPDDAWGPPDATAWEVTAVAPALPNGLRSLPRQRLHGGPGAA